MSKESIEKNHHDKTEKQPEINKAQSEGQSELEFITREELESKLNESESQANKLHEQLLRTQAEMQNIQKRYEKKISDVEKYTIAAFVKELLIVIDNFERAFSEGATVEKDSLFEGIQRTYELFLSTFNKFGIKSIDPKGDIFDPEFHEAISTAPAESEEQMNRVIQVLQKGYLLNDRLIRPALVIVANR